MIYAAIRRYARGLVRCWYRVEVVGRPTPEPGPTILVANHTNGLVDVSFLVGWSDRPVRFLAKFSLFRIPGLAFLARGVRAIPVYRKKDRVPTEWNVTAFQAVHEALGAGEAIGIFPEGESATATCIRTPLRTGAARMALGAERARSGLDLRIVPLSLTYSDRDRFRSRASLVVGESFTPAADLVARGPEDRAAVQSLTERIARSLAETGFPVDDPRDAKVFALARRATPLESRADVARLQALARALNGLRRADPTRADELAARAEVLAADAELELEREPPAPPAGLLAEVVVPLGLAVFAAPIGLARTIARRAPADKFVTVVVLGLFPAGLLWILTIAILVGAARTPGAGLLTAAGLLGIAASLPGSVDARRAARRARRNHDAPDAAARRELLDELSRLGNRAAGDSAHGSAAREELD